MRSTYESDGRPPVTETPMKRTSHIEPELIPQRNVCGRITMVRPEEYQFSDPGDFGAYAQAKYPSLVISIHPNQSVTQVHTYGCSLIGGPFLFSTNVVVFVPTG